MTTTVTDSTPPESKPGNLEDDEISLLDLAIVLAKRKRLILGITTLGTLVALVFSLLMTPQFTATTKILPPEKAQGAAAMAAQMGGLASLAGGSASFLKNPNDLYLAMLKSRTVQDAMVQRFDLLNKWQIKLKSTARKALEGITTATSGKDSIITIEVTDADPQLAADMANAYVEELYKVTKSIATTEAGRRRLFFEAQASQAREALSKAEIAAKQGLEQGGLIKVDDQGRSMVEATARLRGQIAAKEVQIGAMRAYAAENNPEMRMATRELDVLKNELAKAEGAEAKRGLGSNSSAQGFGNLNLLRDLKYTESVYEILARQYELAKIDEAKDAAIIQVLDSAVPPDRKSKPKRAQIVILVALSSLFVAILAAFIVEVLVKARNNPEQSEQLTRLAGYLRAPLLSRSEPNRVRR